MERYLVKGFPLYMYQQREMCLPVSSIQQQAFTTETTRSQSKTILQVCHSIQLILILRFIILILISDVCYLPDFSFHPTNDNYSH